MTLKPKKRFRPPQKLATMARVTENGGTTVDNFSRLSSNRGTDSISFIYKHDAASVTLETFDKSAPQKDCWNLWWASLSENSKIFVKQSSLVRGALLTHVCRFVQNPEPIANLFTTCKNSETFETRYFKYLLECLLLILYGYTSNWPNNVMNTTEHKPQ